MSEQSSFDLRAKSSGPVECLGQNFPSEDARRKHYLALLAQKLLDPAFRKIEGFPIGKDEDILARSDPPYYTACPNPWLSNFVKHHGTPYDHKQPYHREPFAADVSEGKNHPIYNAHSYHTKVPHRAIMRYLLHYTQPGDVVFDGFCGTGMTGVAAQLCGSRKEIQELGYRVQDDGTILNEEGKAFSRLGARHAILNDLSPAATFIAYNYNAPVDVDAFELQAKRILEEVEKELGWMYETKHNDGSKHTINFTVWSDVFTCSECGGEIVFWDTAVDHKAKDVREELKCPKCSALSTKRSLERAYAKRYDKALATTVTEAKTVPVLINYSVGSKRYEKTPDSEDLALVRRINEIVPPYWFPSNRLRDGGETRRNDSIGITHAHHFYTQRNLLALSAVYERAEKAGLPFLFWFTATLTWVGRENRLHLGNYFGKKGGVITSLRGTWYVASLQVETCVFARFRLRMRIQEARNAPFASGQCMVSTQSSSQLVTAANSCDYVFIDPPFGSNLMYSELNALWESWLRVETNNSDEAIEDTRSGKTLVTYKGIMDKCFAEVFRILKPGRWMTVEFSNTSASVWNAIQTSFQEAGFVVANVSALDKQKGSFKAVTTPTAVKQDLVISAYKPNGGLEERFATRGDTEAGVWDFIHTHLKNLPVVKARGGQLEFVAERDPRILYDRMVAFYVGHSTPVPLSSAEFQEGLLGIFPERDGMFFLPEQVGEFDKKRAQVENIGQLTIFVEDERSAINWLRSFLKDRPSSSQDIQPEFMQQLGASWKKWEARPEMSALLDQNFLCYDGVGEVPSQVHSYLSTQFKELRNLPKDHANLRTKAKNRWYVPDPKKNVDVETVRNKRLLEEFWSYLPEGYTAPALMPNKGPVLPGFTVPAPKKPKVKKLKELRSEAVRVGFKHCYQQKDYATILIVAEMLPESVLNEDEQLQMIYDTAVLRAGAAE
jgi:DNA modification methylase